MAKRDHILEDGDIIKLIFDRARRGTKERATSKY